MNRTAPCRGVGGQNMASSFSPWTEKPVAVEVDHVLRYIGQPDLIVDPIFQTIV
jgi:hypothetical protein